MAFRVGFRAFFLPFFGLGFDWGFGFCVCFGVTKVFNVVFFITYIDGEGGRGSTFDKLTCGASWPDWETNPDNRLSKSRLW